MARKKLNPAQQMARLRWDKATSEDTEAMREHARWMTQVRVAKREGRETPEHPSRARVKKVAQTEEE